MARRDALMRITKSLLTRRAELRKRLGMEYDTLGPKGLSATGDSADAAFEHAGEELAFQLGQLESRELSQVERALLRIKQGKYGVCDGCGCRIPVARLNALPYSTLCIKCQREAESDTGFVGELAAMDWDKVRDADGAQDRDVDLADLEIDLSK
ncbi:MAG TPA: TraR/DksA family transcriptional regulator [Fimbriiglobus sp.]|nr:TraR/DksA family transcriptional regulator [Fimbriiglobus sp.]